MKPGAADTLGELMSLPLPVRARLLARGLWAGMQATKRRGPGGTFRELREYRPGDPLRTIDWRASARTDRWLVREVDRITQLRVAIWLDTTESMNYGERGQNKAAVAKTLAAAVALHALRQGHAVALWRQGEARPPRSGYATGAQLVQAIETAEPTDFLLPDVGPIASRIDLLLVLSDFLDERTADTFRQLGLLAARRIEVRLLQVLHDDELNFPFRLPQIFVPLDGDRQREWQLEPRDVRQAYLDNLNAHLTGCIELTRRQQLDFRLHVTSAGLLPSATFLANGAGP